ncbi:hypothetical protein [Lysobacter capsici]|uniref:hypothetical protein n=1 Tax=Lysobacter capsici TaxID=435897 RepID=UPI001C005705|nr:hypothetical protein [Lysobacter capsici]QWF15421.1 hypothetical protein KME82_16730 [Lysobacter capsici]
MKRQAEMPVFQRFSPVPPARRGEAAATREGEMQSAMALRDQRGRVSRCAATRDCGDGSRKGAMQDVIGYAVGFVIGRQSAARGQAFAHAALINVGSMPSALNRLV